MSKKLHITKLENDQIEVGIQLRDVAPPIPKNNRIEFVKSTGEFKCRVNETDFSLSFDVLDSDPTTIKNKQVWINRTDNMLKWQFGGIVKTVALDDKMRVNASKSASEYQSTLNDAELSTMSGIPETSPKAMIDAFLVELFEANYTNIEVKSSRLKVVDGQTDGEYTRERRISSATNYVEGIAVVTSQGLAPKEITDNNDGTHTLIFSEDITEVLNDSSKVLMYEEVIENKIKKGYHLLQNLKPAVLEIESVSYDVVTKDTTVVINDSDLDLTLGVIEAERYNSVRVFPLNLEVSAGGDSLTGTMGAIAIQEAHTMDNMVRVLGKPTYLKIRDAFQEGDTGRGALDFAVNHSPNKKYWIIAIASCRGITTPALNIFYSTDSLKTIQKFDYEQKMSSAAYWASAILRDHLGGDQLLVNNAHTFVADDGRFIFYNRHYTKGYERWTYQFGHLNPALGNIWIKQSTAYWGDDAGVLADGSTYHYYSCAAPAVDFEYNVTAFPTIRNGESATKTFHSLIDWDAKKDYSKGWTNAGASSSPAASANGFCFFKDFEGERMFFQIQEHSNNHLYANKCPMADILLVPSDGGNQNVDTTAQFGGYGYAFSESESGGNRYQQASFMHSCGAAGNKITDFGWDEENDRLVIAVHDSGDFIMRISIIDFGRTTGGAFSEHKLETSLVPDNGNFTLAVTDELTTTTEITSPIPYSADTNQIKAVLEALTFVDTVNVVGDFASGFDITFETKKPITVVENTNSMTSGGTAVVITLTEIEEGFEPIWLRWLDTFAEGTELFNAARGGRIKLRRNVYIPHNCGYTDATNSRIGPRRIGQQMRVHGKQIIFTECIEPNQNASDLVNVELFKIPDYTECIGEVYSEEMGSGNRILSYERTKLSHKYTVPEIPFGGLQYADGLVPLRTFAFSLDTIWDLTGNGQAPTHKNGVEIALSLKIVGMASNGIDPDESNVIAVCTSPLPIIEITTMDQYKCHAFNFDNVKLPPGQEVALILETNITQEEMEETGLRFRVRGQDIALGKTRKMGNGIWVDDGFNVWIRHYDYYYNKIHLMHESGYNKAAWSFGAWTANGMTTINPSIYPIGAVDSKLYNATYLHIGQRQDADTYPHVRTGTMFQFEIDDTIGVDRMPIVKDAKVMGYDADEKYDPNLVFCYFPMLGNEDYDWKRCADKVPYTNTLFESTNYYNQGMPQIFNCVMTCGGYLSYLKETPEGFTDHAEGQVVDSKFATGMATEFNNAGKLIFSGHPDKDIRIGRRPFIFEQELEPNELDLTHSETVDIHCYDQYQGFQSSIYHRKYYFPTWNSENTILTVTKSYEEVATVYHRVRYVRDENGLKLFRNFSKVGGEWIELTLGYDNTFEAAAFGNGLIIGHNSMGSQIAIGGYSQNASHDFEGRIGYTKLSINATEFTYDGVTDKQIPLFFARNFGEVSFALDHYCGGYHNGNGKLNGTISNVNIVRDNVKSALVPTNDNMLKYGQSISAGQKASLKLDVTKVSDEDPASVQGYSVEFDRK